MIPYNKTPILKGLLAAFFDFFERSGSLIQGINLPHNAA